MTRQELIRRIKRREAQCALNPGAAFGVDEVVELADGILAVRDTDDEHTVYFDKSKCQIRDGAFEDTGLLIPSFPADTGFIVNVMSRNWQSIQRTAMSTLKPFGRRKIKWHKEPVKVSYLPRRPPLPGF